MKTYCRYCKKITDSLGPSKIITSNKTILKTFCKTCGKNKSETCFYAMHGIKKLGKPPNF